MQNKANFKKAGMFVNYYLQKDCENEQSRRLWGNKPKQSQSFDFAQDKFFESGDRSLPLRQAPLGLARHRQGRL